MEDSLDTEGSLAKILTRLLQTAGKFGACGALAGGLDVKKDGREFLLLYLYFDT